MTSLTNLARIAFSLATVLACTAAIAEPATLKSELVDVMRWEHINRTRPFFLSSAEWATHCGFFHGADWKEKCREKQLEVQNGEREATALLYRFGLENTVRKRGWLALHLPKDLKSQETHGEFDVAWIEIVGKLIAGYRSPESDKCMREYACSALFDFSPETLALEGLRLWVHSESR